LGEQAGIKTTALRMAQGLAQLQLVVGAGFGPGPWAGIRSGL
jgi:hypothetical protein